MLIAALHFSEGNECWYILVYCCITGAQKAQIGQNCGCGRMPFTYTHDQSNSSSSRAKNIIFLHVLFGLSDGWINGVEQHFLGPDISSINSFSFIFLGVLTHSISWGNHLGSLREGVREAIWVTEGAILVVWSPQFCFDCLTCSHHLLIIPITNTGPPIPATNWWIGLYFPIIHCFWRDLTKNIWAGVIPKLQHPQRVLICKYYESIRERRKSTGTFRNLGGTSTSKTNFTAI